MNSERPPSREGPGHTPLQRRGAIRRRSSSTSPRLPRVTRRGSSSSNRSELTGDTTEEMVAKNARDLQRMKDLLSQARKLAYESPEAKRLYEQANRLGAAVRERQALMDSINQSITSQEFAVGDDSQPLGVRNTRNHEGHGQRTEGHHVRARSRARSRDRNRDRD